MSRVRRLDDDNISLSSENEDEEREHVTSTILTRNVVAFWILGLCNNFAYVIMLSAAKDILENGHQVDHNSTTLACRDHIVTRSCQPLSTGSVLLADILPAMFIKITAPLFIHSIPFGMRHVFVVGVQALSFILVATSTSVVGALLGVALASFGSGMGEVSFLSLASFFNVRVISSWSSGTGGAGIFGALTYAILTDRALLGMSPSNALLTMLVVPAFFAVTYWFILSKPVSVHRVNIFDPTTYFVPNVDTVCRSRRTRSRSMLSDSDARPLIEHEERPDRDSTSEPSSSMKFHLMLPLLKYMIPLAVVYCGEYFINQGLVELLEFDCSHGFHLNVASQYRWYQVLYQLGVFISRSSADCFEIPSRYLPLLAVLQILNAVFLFIDAVHYFIPHISILFVIILYEGLLGGFSYVNTFRAIHKEVVPEAREFSLGFASMADTFGIVVSGFAAIPVHNFICSLPL